MLYSLTKSIIHLALRGYFRKIVAIGEENIPKNGPIIFIANHPSALIDPLVVSILIRKKLHFIAGAEFFGKGFKSWLLREQYNMIPVYRPKEGNGKNVDNTEMFSECYKRLDKDGAILVFPEGSSVTQNRLRSLKTGTLRILAGFNKVSPDKVVHVIPLGLNYSSAHQFRSNILMKIGPPIDSEQLPLNADDPQAIKDLTQVLENSLQQEIFHIEDYKLNPLVTNIYELLRHNIISEKESEEKFKVRKELIKVISHFQETEPETVQLTKDLILTYFKQLKQLNIDQYFLNERDKSKYQKKLIVAVFFLPLFFVGLIANSLPFLLTQLWFRSSYLPRLKQKDHNRAINPAFSATISYSIGTLIFLFWFISISIFVSFQTVWWMGFLSFATLYFLGQFSIWYRGVTEYLTGRWKLNSVIKNNPEEIEKLIFSRKKIISLLMGYWKKYESVKSLKV